MGSPLRRARRRTRAFQLPNGELTSNSGERQLLFVGSLLFCDLGEFLPLERSQQFLAGFSVGRRKSFTSLDESFPISFAEPHQNSAISDHLFKDFNGQLQRVIRGLTFRIRRSIHT